MKNYTTSKKIITLLGYLLALILASYFVYLTTLAVKDINAYVSGGGKLGFVEKLDYTMSNFALLVQAAILAIATKIHSIVAPNKIAKAHAEEEEEEKPKPAKTKKTTKKSPAKRDPFKKMTLLEAANEIGVSKDRVYRYCKTLGIPEAHEGESPIMLFPSEFRAIEEHFTQEM